MNNKPWKLKDGEKYWTISALGASPLRVEYTLYKGSSSDKYNKRIKNYFRTKKDALEMLKAFNKLSREYYDAGKKAIEKEKAYKQLLREYHDQ